MRWKSNQDTNDNFEKNYVLCTLYPYTQYLIQAPLISNTFEMGQNLR